MRAVIQTLDLNGIGCEVFEDGSYELDDYGPSIVALRPDQVDLLPHVAAYVARIAELEAALERRVGAEIDSWQECPACGDLTVVANRFGWVCTRCGAHREWGSELCAGDYCEDGCDKCVGTP